MASRFPTSAPRSGALAAMLAAISPAIAFATDLPLPPMVTKAPPLPAAVAPYNWSGLYVGGGGGAGSGSGSGLGPVPTPCAFVQPKSPSSPKTRRWICQL